MAGEEFVEDGAEGVDVGVGAEGGAVGVDLFGGHVGGGAAGTGEGGGGGVGLSPGARDAEVGDLGGDLIPGGVWVAVEEDVRGLQVEVKQPGVVNFMNGGRNGFEQAGGVARREGGKETFIEAAALDEFEHEIEPRAGFADLVELDDVGMADFGSGLSFAEPESAFAGAGGGSAGDDFQGDVARELGIPGEIDDAHSAATDLSYDREAGDYGEIVRAGHERRTGDRRFFLLKEEPIEGRLAGVASIDVRVQDGVDRVVVRAGAESTEGVEGGTGGHGGIASEVMKLDQERGCL